LSKELLFFNQDTFVKIFEYFLYDFCIVDIKLDKNKDKIFRGWIEIHGITYIVEIIENSWTNHRKCLLYREGETDPILKLSCNIDYSGMETYIRDKHTRNLLLRLRLEGKY
jgi:hypothetical protein